MSLVADYGSDSEPEDTEPVQQSSSKPSFSSLLPPPKTVAPAPSKPASSFSSLLPPPKSVPVSTSPSTATTKTPSTIISSNATPTKTKRIQIFVDLPKPSANPDSDTEDADDRDAKKPRLGTGSGLTALLPAPKNTRSHVPSAKGSLGAGTVGGGFVPYALTKKREEGAAKAKGGVVVKEEEVKIVVAKVEEKVDKVATENEVENEDKEIKEATDSATGGGIVKSFFPLGLSITAAPPVDLSIEDPAPTPTSYSTQPVEPANYARTAADAYSYDSNAAYDGADPAVYQQYYYDETAYAGEQAGSATTAQGEGSAGIDDQVLAKLGGFRRGEAQAFEIKDISQSEQIQRDAWAPTSQSAAPVSSGSSGMKVSGMQKRKHNIMYLAAQAKDMERKLMDSFANNRKTKRETQSKYGF